MQITAAILGFAFGFVGSIPIAGPVAALVFSRGLQQRMRSALFLAAGAALAESAYVYLAFRGFSELLTRHAWATSASGVVATATLVGLGLRFLWTRGSSLTRTPADPRESHARSFLLGLTITALNPAVILTWTAAVAALYGFGFARFDPREGLPFAIGAYAGIVGWFATLLSLLQRFRARLSRETVGRAIQGMGLLLIILGLGAAASFACGPSPA